MRRVVALLSVFSIFVAAAASSALLAGCDDSPIAADAVADSGQTDATGTDVADHDTPPSLTVACGMDPAVHEGVLSVVEGPDEGLSLAGTVVDSAGTPVLDVRVLACTGTICHTGTTNAAGEYSFSKVGSEKHKMQVGAYLKGLMSFNFYQDPRTTPVLASAVVVLDQPNTPAPLDEDVGGTVDLADGKLVITAPGGILYDFGEPKELLGVEVPIATLPPFDFDPVACSSAPSAAFLINPLKTKLKDGSFEVTAKLNAVPGTKYGIWVVDGDTAEVHKEATATADANGDVVKDPGTTLHHLDMLIFVPE